MAGLVRVALILAFILPVMVSRPEPEAGLFVGYLALIALTYLIDWWLDSVRLKGATG